MDPATDIQEVLRSGGDIDTSHWEMVFVAADICFQKPPLADVPSLPGENPLKDMNFSAWAARLLEAGQLLEASAVAISIGTEVALHPAKQGRPATPYLLATIELMDVWTFLTQSLVPEPTLAHRDKHSKESGRECSDFIYWSLKMIDPAATSENARTAIRRARQAQPLIYGKRKPIDLTGIAHEFTDVEDDPH